MKVQGSLRPNALELGRSLLTQMVITPPKTKDYLLILSTPWQPLGCTRLGSEYLCDAARAGPDARCCRVRVLPRSNFQLSAIRRADACDAGSGR